MAVGTSSSMLGSALLLLVLSSATNVHGGSSSNTAPRSPLDELCIGLGGWYVTPDMCVSTLCIDPSCRSARSLPELGVLATKLTVANATVAKASIESALAHARKVMQSCLQLYVGIVPRMQRAARSVAAGRYTGVPEMMWQTYRDVSYVCDEVALPKENDEFFMMAYVVHAVLEEVQRSIIG